MRTFVPGCRRPVFEGKETEIIRIIRNEKRRKTREPTIDDKNP